MTKLGLSGEIIRERCRTSSTRIVLNRRLYPDDDGGLNLSGVPHISLVMNYMIFHMAVSIYFPFV